MDIVEQLIAQQKETDAVDFKSAFYKKEKKYDLIKDMLAFANNIINEEKYIIFGVDDKTFKICEEIEMPDISDLQQFISEYVEPAIPFEANSAIINNKKIGFIKIIRKNSNLPYVIKKDYMNGGKTYLRKGEIYIRKGATNFIATRNDLNAIYENKKNCAILNHFCFNKNIKDINYMCCNLLINNNLDNDLIVINAKIRLFLDESIIDLDKCIVSTNKITEKDKFFLGKSNKFIVNSMNSRDIFFNFIIDKKLKDILKNTCEIKSVLMIETENNQCFSFILNKKEKSDKGA